MNKEYEKVHDWLLEEFPSDIDTDVEESDNEEYNMGKNAYKYEILSIYLLGILFIFVLRSCHLQ